MRGITAVKSAPRRNPSLPPPLLPISSFPLTLLETTFQEEKGTTHRMPHVTMRRTSRPFPGVHRETSNSGVGTKAWKFPQRSNNKRELFRVGLKVVPGPTSTSTLITRAASNRTRFPFARPLGRHTRGPSVAGKKRSKIGLYIPYWRQALHCWPRSKKG